MNFKSIYMSAMFTAFLEESTSVNYLGNIFSAGVGEHVHSLFSFLNESKPVISINQCSLNGKPFLWTIVSRRSCFRAGTRLFTRGIDVHGNVANFVETEQIVEFSGDRSSFVQVSTVSILMYYQCLKLQKLRKFKLRNSCISNMKRHYSTVFCRTDSLTDFALNVFL